MVKSDILDILNKIALDNGLGLIVIENPNPTMLSKGSNVACRTRNGTLYVPDNFNLENWSTSELAHLIDVEYEIIDQISLIQDIPYCADCVIVENHELNMLVAGKSLNEIESLLNCKLLKVENRVFRQWEAKNDYKTSIVKTLLKNRGGK